MERALTTVVATCYLLGVSTRRMEKLVESLRITARILVPGHPPNWTNSSPQRNGPPHPLDLPGGRVPKRIAGDGYHVTRAARQLTRSRRTAPRPTRCFTTERQRHI